MTSRRLTGIAIVVLTWLAAPAAEAKTYCVGPVACPAGGLARSSLDDAVNGAGGADDAPDADTILIGPGAYSEQSLTADERVSIVGAGIGQTTITPNSGSDPIILANGLSSISDLSVRVTYNSARAIRLQNGADASRVEVTSASDTLTNVSGFVADDPGTTLTAVRTDLSPAPVGSAAYFFEGGTISDSTLVGGIGISPSDTTIVRSTIRASIGLRAFGTEDSLARDVLITPHPRDPGQFSAGVEVTSGNQGANASLSGSHLTVVGPGSAGTGLAARASNAASSGTATLTVRDAIVWGTSLALARTGRASPQRADLTVSYSSYNGAAIANTGNGSLGASQGNETSNANPGFVDPASADYRLRYDSPLLDRGTPNTYSIDGAGDRLARARRRDGDGDGDARRDIGAFEYQRLAPIVAFGFSPQAPLMTTTTVAFANTSEDPDGDPLTYAWSFGDGATSTLTAPSHAYATAGTRQATLTATDATGLTGTAASAIDVVAPAKEPERQDNPEPVATAPTLSRASLLRTRFAAVRKGGRISARKRVAVKRGTRIRYRLSRAARVSIVVERVRAGRVRGQRTCVAPTKRNRKARACTRVTRVGTLTATGSTAGAHTVPFTGRMRGKALAAGRYRVRLMATGPEGRRSKETRLTFTVLRG